MQKPLTVTIKKKRPRKTKYDIERLHERQLDIIDRFSAVYRLNPAMLTLWEVVFKSEELIAGQIRLLKARTGEVWYAAKYWKFRKKLFKELQK